MLRLSTAAALTSILVLAACAGDAPMMSERRPATPPGGIWEVIEAANVASTGGTQSPYIGQRMALFADTAGDPAGRVCKVPTYLGYEAPAALVLGQGEDAHRPVLEITCAGESFGTYVGSADGALRTRVSSWLLTLKRIAEPQPPPIAQPTPIASPQSEPVAPPVAAPVRAASGPLVYLASYKSPEAARKGFEMLTKHSAMVAKSVMVLKEVDLGAKGKWLRLFAQAGDAAQTKKLCAELGKRLPACGGVWAK
jgi:hypothetical protein